MKTKFNFEFKNNRSLKRFFLNTRKSVFLYKIILMKYWIGIVVLFVTISCQNETPQTMVENTIAPDGKTLYKERCVSCHGADGKLGFAGAKDLTKSKKTHQEIINQVMNGKGAMTPFKNILREDEIDAVSLYTVSLQNK
jgi:mono/diheme cytochrome c family protein